MHRLAVLLSLTSATARPQRELARSASSSEGVSASTAVIVAACGVIARLSRSSANQLAMGAAGVSLLLSVFQAHRANNDVVDAVCRAMSNLASNNGTMRGACLFSLLSLPLLSLPLLSFSLSRSLAH